MKKNILAIFLLVVTFAGCTKLEEDVYSFIAPQDFYRNDKDLDLTLTAVYKLYQTAFGGGDVYNYFMIVEVASETGAPSRTKDNPHLYNSWANANDADNTIKRWSNAYRIINQANVVLGRGAPIKMDETLKKRMFAEARFMRGLTYFHLLRLYGGVPIPSSFTQGLDSLEISRKSVDEVYDYVIADLEYAAENLPLKSKYASADLWRASKGAAQALLGKVFLYRGSMTGEAAYFQKSKQFSGEVIASGEYALEQDFKNLWMWWNPSNKNGKESIFEIQFGYKGSGNGSRLHIDGGINIVDANFGSYMFHRFGPSFTAYKSFSDQDARKEATFLTSMKLSTGSTIKWLESDKGFYPGAQQWPTACPGNLKYYDRSAQSSTSESPANDFYVIRFAEVLLNYAEAENELNGPTKDAYDKVELVRARARLANFPNGLSKQQFSDLLYKERTLELLGEGQVYYDALRTNRLGKEVKNEVEYGVANGLFLYSRLMFIPKKNFLWKIPTYDLNSSAALVQNPDNVSDQ